MANNEEKGFASVHINWVRRIYGKLPKSIEKYRHYYFKYITYFDKTLILERIYG